MDSGCRTEVVTFTLPDVSGCKGAFMAHFRLLELHLTTECRSDFPSVLLRNPKGYFHFWAESYLGLLANQLVSVRLTAAPVAVCNTSSSVWKTDFPSLITVCGVTTPHQTERMCCQQGIHSCSNLLCLRYCFKPF
jgi:hypothetical protein